VSCSYLQLIEAAFLMSERNADAEPAVGAHVARISADTVASYTVRVCNERMGSGSRR